MRWPWETLRVKSSNPQIHGKKNQTKENKIMKKISMHSFCFGLDAGGTLSKIFSRIDGKNSRQRTVVSSLFDGKLYGEEKYLRERRV